MISKKIEYLDKLQKFYQRSHDVILSDLHNSFDNRNTLSFTNTLSDLRICESVSLELGPSLTFDTGTLESWLRKSSP